MSLSLGSERWPQISTTTAAVVLGGVDELMLVAPDGGRVRLRAGLRIGQAPDNDVRIDDVWASRRHCVIDREGASFNVRDLGSKNGTFVNEVRIASSALSAGAMLTVGRTRLRVVRGAERSSPLIGDSPAMRLLRRRIGVLAPTLLPLLVVGETGTGKELVARQLHDESGRSGPFVALNCGAIATELVESELFGHERGAFTGATQKKLGVFQEADQGTLFLDEIGELPLSLQPRLLRALEVGAVRPVGATREQRVGVRVIAATHVDLEDAVRKSRFREDLYYRLCGDVLRTPTLRERPADISALAEHMLTNDGARSRLTEDALAALVDYAWPGNVRELRNVLRRAAVLAGPSIAASDLDLRPVLPQIGDGETLRIADRPFLDLEKEILARALKRSGGNKRAAAHMLGIPKSTMCDKAKRYGL